MERKSTDQVPDGELWLKVRQHDGAALGVLFDRYADHLHRIAAARVGPHLAQDVVSMAFYESWRKRASVTPDEAGSILPWLVGLTKNVARNIARSERRYKKLLDQLPRSEDATRFDDLVADRVSAEADAKRLAPILEALPRELQLLIFLCDVQGLTASEAAQRLSIPVGTAKSRLHRAHRRIAAFGEQHPRLTIAISPDERISTP